MGALGFKYEFVYIQNSALNDTIQFLFEMVDLLDCYLLGHPHPRISCFLHRFFSQHFSHSSITTHHIASSGFKYVSVSSMSAWPMLYSTSKPILTTQSIPCAIIILDNQCLMNPASVSLNTLLSPHSKENRCHYCRQIINQVNKQRTQRQIGHIWKLDM